MKLKSFILISLLTLPLMIMAQTIHTNSANIPLKLPEEHNILLQNTIDFSLPTFSDIRELSPFYQSEDEVEIEDNTELLAHQLTSFASKFLGTRYSRGASGPKAFDCSGFVGYLFKQFGIKLSRSSSTQYKEGVKVNDKDLKPGDLMFFSGRGGKGGVGHVAMVVDVNSDGSCTFIHASTSKGVTYQRFPDGGYYSKRYIGAKRILGVVPQT